MLTSKFIFGKLSVVLTLFAVGVSSQSEAAIYIGATSRSEFELIYRSEVFSESRNFSNYGRSTTLSVELGMATIVSDAFYLLNPQVVSGSQMITNPTTFKTHTITLAVTFTELSLQAYAASAQLQSSLNGNLSFFPQIQHSPVVLKGAYSLMSDSGSSISGAFDTIVNLSGFQKEINRTEPLIGVSDFPTSIDYADRTLFGYSRGSFTLFSDEIDGIPITMNLERLEVGRDSSLEFYPLAAIPEPSAFAFLGASGAFLLLRRSRQGKINQGAV